MLLYPFSLFQSFKTQDCIIFISAAVSYWLVPKNAKFNTRLSAHLLQYVAQYEKKKEKSLLYILDQLNESKNHPLIKEAL